MVLLLIRGSAGSILGLPPDLIQQLHCEFIPERMDGKFPILLQDSIYALISGIEADQSSE